MNCDYSLTEMWSNNKLEVKACRMEGLENNENKESDINLVDFPFICQICLKRSDSRLCKAEDYLLDLYLSITKIDVSLAANFPRNICHDCNNKLEDMSLFIDMLKSIVGRPVKKFTPKKEIVECGRKEINENVIKTEETPGKFEQDVDIERSEICQICSSTSCLTVLEERADLIQLVENITNIDVEAEANVLSRTNSICYKCTDELEEISSFISLSLYNHRKLDNDIGGIRALKTESCSEEITIDTRSFEPYENAIGVKMENTFEESACSYKGRDSHAIIDINIKEESVDRGLVTSKENPVEFVSCEGDIMTDGHSHIFSEGLGVDTETHCVAEPSKPGEKPFKYKRCDNSFTVKENSSRHMLVQTGKKNFKCEYCEKSFPRKLGLQRHSLVHSGETPFKCDCCQRVFAIKSDFQRHLRTHAGKRPFKCDSCEKSFAHRQNLIRHLLVHSGERPFKCHICEKSFTLKTIMQIHVRTHTGEKLFKCDLCPKGFIQRWGLQQHLISHTKEKPFKCNSCEKLFSNKRSLRHHGHIHTGEKPFKCDSCEKSFCQKKSYQRHVLIHTGKTPFQCGCCKKSFDQKSALQRHMLSHTGK